MTHNDKGALHRRPRHDLVSRPSERSNEPGLTALQDWLITAYLVLEDARDELTAEQWRAFTWILCDRIGQEAAQLMVGEALLVLKEAA